MDYNSQYIRDFQRDYLLGAGGRYNLDRQVPHLASLAEHYYNRYIVTRDWTDCIRSHSLYNSIAARKPHSEGFKHLTFKVQQEYWGELCHLSYHEQTEITTSLKLEIEQIRDDIRSSLHTPQELVTCIAGVEQNMASIDELKLRLTHSMKSISIDCSQKMIGFTKRIIQESVRILSLDPPCAFTAVAIGSLARGEATPYSDLEYLFLIEKKTPEIERYFESLAITTYFLIGNLGETKLSYMAIKELKGWFDDTSKSGFKIDGLSEGAGNIPTGSGKPATLNRFIITPDELCEQFEIVLNNPREDSVRGDLSAMLLYRTPLFNYDLENNLLPKLNRKISAVNPSMLRDQANKEMLISDMGKFDFSPDLRLRNQAYNMNVKRQLFRFPSILLFDLSIIHNLVEHTTWDTANLLCSRHQISDQFRSSMLFQLACACYIRLSAYLFYDSHDDRISVADTIRSPSNRRRRRHSERWYVSTGLMLVLCNEIIPMKQQLSESAKNVMLTCSLYNREDASSATTLNTLLYSGRYSQALNALLHLIPNATSNLLDVNALRDSFLEPDQMVIVSAEILFCNSRFRVALKLYKYMNDHTPDDAVKVNMADCYRKLSLYNQALDVLSQCQTQSADLFYIRGRIYMDLKQFDVAEDNLVEAFQLYYNQVPPDEASRDYYGNTISSSGFNYQPNLIAMSPLNRISHIQNTTPDLLDCIHALAQLYWKQDKPELRESYDCKYQEYFHQALEMYRLIYGSESDHVTISTVLSNIGTNHFSQQQYDLADGVFKESLGMRHRLYGGNHVDIARILNKLGLSSMIQGNYNAAEMYYKDALKMYKRVFSLDINHPDIANVETNYMRLLHRQSVKSDWMGLIVTIFILVAIITTLFGLYFFMF